MKTQCACGSCDTDVIHQTYEYVYKGYVQEVERSYTECQDCGLEFQTTEQINQHYEERCIAEFRIDRWILDNEGGIIMFTLTLQLDTGWPIEDAFWKAKAIADMLDVTVEFEIEKITVHIDRYSDFEYTVGEFNSKQYRGGYHP